MGDGAIVADEDERPPRFSDVLRVRAFAVLFGAEIQSVIGSQLARVALSVLVYQRTGSATDTALTYAITFLPAILGGFVLAGIGDQLPRRAVMIGCDLARAGLFAAMALPGLPTWVLLVLLAVAVFIGPAFSAAEVSYLAGALTTEYFRAGTGLRMIMNQAAQVVGFALGGVLTALLAPRGALLLNAATFLLSAVVVLGALRGSEPPYPKESPESPESRPERAVVRLWRDRRLRVLLGLSSLAGLFVVPEGLAAPFASHTGASTTELGFLLASIPLGSAIGVVVLVRWVPKRRRAAAAGWMAVGCGLPLVVPAIVASWPLALVCWLASGVLAAYQVELMTSIVQLIPPGLRSRGVGFASSILLGAQGVGLIVFGEVAHLTTSAHAIGIAGISGSALALLLVMGSRRVRPRPRPAHRALTKRSHRPAPVAQLSGR